MLKSLLSVARTGGRPKTKDLREIVNGMFYLLHAGCAWDITYTK
ncbi:MAG: transposase [Spirulina sp. SIO3F2]|nr:transposase [Spirulina sp. SIO3F2]